MTREEDDEKIKEIEEKWSKSSSIYNYTVTEAQIDIWNLLSRIKRGGGLNFLDNKEEDIYTASDGIPLEDKEEP